MKALDYKGSRPTNSQYRQIAHEVVRLVEAGCDLSALKRELQAGTGRGINNIVGLYLSRLRKFVATDLIHQEPVKTAQRPFWRDLERAPAKPPAEYYEAKNKLVPSPRRLRSLGSKLDTVVSGAAA